MTDRVPALLVTFETNIREDELQPWIDAIKLLSNVISVEPAPANNMEISIAESRVRMELRTKLWNALR